MKTTLGIIMLAVVLTPLTGCENAGDSSRQAREQQDSHQPLDGFSWIVPGQLAAMPVPGRERTLDQDAAFLEQDGIRVLVSLTEDPPDHGSGVLPTTGQRSNPRGPMAWGQVKGLFR